MIVTYNQDMRHHPLSHGSRQPVVFYCFGRLRQLLGTFPLLVKRITLWMQNSTGFARIDAIRETFLAPHWLSLSRDNTQISLLIPSWPFVHHLAPLTTLESSAFPSYSQIGQRVCYLSFLTPLLTCSGNF